MANSAPDIEFTHHRVIRSDGPVTFQCSKDRNIWPWLALHPHHPIALQNLQYWASVEAGRERGTFDGTRWTALTWTKWSCGAGDVGPPVRGVSENVDADGKLQSKLTFFDARDAMVSTMYSIGVEFRTRDFEAWRAKAKQDSEPEVDPASFSYAEPEAVGSAGVGPSFLSPLQDSQAPHALGLMTLDNAFPPAHPFMSGSGDHVNATHLAEAVHQFMHLLENGAPLRITGGEMRFTRYVELGRVFTVELVERSATSVSAKIVQGGRDCTHVTLQFEAA
ncbi:hypothetical protein QWY75_00165 [Pontixanthobacter aestiaquae]|uniref:Uncharacterized protein n=1 Tax=Pontixanthobacter aestiaquae TaxID=1509367 RepID=A0A844Z6X0_9SPHN|nr:hypothetical protein [Pontixanthobacter aestiaquae]MDN3644612.1 hypothetical protein [Pontixanthobacter aestiaquae]MXO84381.1 hypothetical protein [Pontixanthobacter aestiaquae]